AAAKDLSLLLRGETGVGKEILARLVHRESPRAGGPFVAINCAAINEGVAESTLFGHEKGAFTGALSRQLGVFESARGGTLLLDEIGELSERMQARLLRVLEEREITRVGGAEAIEVDVRLLAATHRDLHREVEAGRFRQDLLYRVAVLTLEIPPLRDRPADIPFLAERMLADLCPGATLSEDAVAELMRRPFRGNVRELRNLLEGAAALCEGTQITARDLPGPPPRGIESCAGATLETKLEDVERASIAQALEACGGNQSAAAKRLGITRRALIYRMEKHGLKPKPSSERCPEPDQG
ncbi:MAG: sigma-54 dependent transcriptional regulator, partial [Myxococcales bacterium]|nr:sigma-54 dependent transcriptional regulator [Myxococcales bacterium]